jgi:3-oxoacyl-[acyl-carrier-protein] synthase II
MLIIAFVFRKAATNPRGRCRWRWKMPALGHPQGASGAAGLGAALCAMHTGVIPPTINLDEPDPDCDLDYVANEARELAVRVALCNCIGFGSKNSALVIERV